MRTIITSAVKIECWAVRVRSYVPRMAECYDQRKIVFIAGVVKVEHFEARS